MIGSPNKIGVVRHAVAAMGTRFEFVLEDGPQAAAIAEEAGELVLEWHDMLSAFTRGSVVGRINGSGGKWIRIDGEVAELLAACASLHAETGGAFDPTIGSAMRAFGHRGDADACGMAVSGMVVPGMVVLGMDRVELDGPWVRLADPGVELDLGGIAKGHALDLVAARFREHGIQSALAHGGTSTAVSIGRAPDGTAWRVRLGAEREAPVIELVDGAVSVSDIAGRVADGTGHVVDPRSGLAVSHRRRAAVTGASARWCDAWSTALLVLGAGEAEPSGGSWMVWDGADLEPSRGPMIELADSGFVDRTGLADRKS